MDDAFEKPITTVELRDRLASGDITAVDYAKTCIARVEEREPEIEAWVWFDKDHILSEAAELDALRSSGAALGPLHGLPVGVKDVIDTRGIATENGCPLDVGRIPDADAEVVARLKAAGAIMFGKTVTTELAFLHPGKTRNPHDLNHTPGGSSSGSAAAVSDDMIPLAIGTQTGGSVIRPASFCGIVGYKPTFDAISTAGVLCQSQSLDTVGVFAKDLAGAALLGNALGGPSLVSLPVRHDAPTSVSTPVLGFVRPPGWDDADRSLREEFERLVADLGDQVVEAQLPPIFDRVAAERAQINNAEMAYNFRRYIEKDAEALSPETQAAIKEGQTVRAEDYIAAMERRASLAPSLEPLFSNCDAIICPSALGPAPAGLTFTGDSIFNGLWTMAGMPAVTLPLLTAPGALPIGLQLVGRTDMDAKLFQTAHWLWEWAIEEGRIS